MGEGGKGGVSARCKFLPLRMLRRHISNAASEVAKNKGEKSELDLDDPLQLTAQRELKTLQLIEASVLLVSRWNFSSREDDRAVEAAVAKFRMEWHAIHVNMMSRPVVKFECDYLFAKVLEVTSSQPAHSGSPEA